MEEKKNYSIIGKVEIGTDEYRDLIEQRVEMESDRDEYRSKYWSEQNKTKELQEKIDAQEKSISHYRDFVNSNEDIKLEYKMYLKSKETD